MNTQLTPEQFGAIGDGAHPVEDFAAFNELIHAAYLADGANVTCRRDAIYTVWAGQFYATTNGTNTVFDVPGLHATYPECVKVRVRTLSLNQNPAIGPIVIDNSGFVLRPYIDFDLVLDNTSPQLRLLNPAWSSIIADANNVKIEEGLFIQFSHFKLDGNQCEFTGSARWTAEGAPTVQGQYPPQGNNHFDNFNCVRFGDFPPPKGPILVWQHHSTVSNITKQGPSGTAFNMHMCTECWMWNIKNTGAGNGAIGVLFFHNTKCTLDGATIKGTPDGSDLWLEGAQIKGGVDCTMTNMDVIDCGGGGGGGDVGYFIRGDLPYGVTYMFGIYPYTEGGWGVPDTQRESRNCWFTYSKHEYTSAFLGAHKFNTSFNWQEATAGGFDHCTSINAAAVKVTRTVTGTESDPHVYDCSVQNSANRTLDMLGHIDNPLPGVDVQRFVGNGAVGLGTYGNYLDNLKLLTVSVNGASLLAVQINNSAAGDIDGLTMTNSGGGLVVSAGAQARAPLKLRNVHSSASVPFSISSPVDAVGLDPYFDTKVTTTAAVILLRSFTIPTGQAYDVDVTWIATVSGVVNTFRKTVHAVNVGGVITLSNPVTVTNNNPSGLVGPSLTVLGGLLKVNIAGKLNTPVTWKTTDVIFS